MNSTMLSWFDAFLTFTMEAVKKPLSDEAAAGILGANCSSRRK
jgi:hypothetical protein